jgi:serine/threonine-protein kinase HipA
MPETIIRFHPEALREAENEIDTIEEIVKIKWYHTARRAGVTEKDCEKIASAFAYAGFR